MPALASNSPATPAAPDYSNWALVVRLLRMTWVYKYRCIQVLVTQVVLLAMGLMGLNLTGVGIDYIRHAVDPAVPAADWPAWIPSPAQGSSTMHGLVIICAAILVLALLRSVFNYAYSVGVGVLTQHLLVVDLRTRVFDKLQKLSFRFFDENASGSIINRCTSDVQNTRTFVDGVVLQVFIMFVSLTVYIIYMVHISLVLTLACLATTPLLWARSVHFARSIRPAYMESRELMDDLVLSFSETIQGMATLKGFAIEDAAAERFAKSNDHVAKQRHGIFCRVSIYSPTMDMLTQVNMLILLGFGGWMAIHGQIPLGTGLVVFAGLLQQFSGQVNTVASVADSIQLSLTGAKRVFEILDAPFDVESKPDAKPLGRPRGEIIFENVSFSYRATSTVLKDISFSVSPGEMVALAGATGSGKSVLMSLIPRFYDPAAGRILLDGRDLREVPLDELRRSIGLVFQENFLFSDTVAANIAFGNPGATPAQIERAAKIAAADGFIRELPQGYDTLLGENGTNLSGGQRQRLAIARAVLPDPAILLLDDPTAAVDPGTEHEIITALESAVRGRTSFIVAHRLGTLRRAGRVLVLDRGRLVQQGTHRDLMEQPGLYRRAIGMQGPDSETIRLLQHTRMPFRTKRDELVRPETTPVPWTNPAPEGGAS